MRRKSVLWMAGAEPSLESDRELVERGRQKNSKQELQEFDANVMEIIREEWSKIPLERIMKLVDSTPHPITVP